MTTHVDDVMTGVGLLIDGAVVPGAEGTYPVTNPAGPAEVVLQAPATSPAQLDRAVDGGAPVPAHLGRAGDGGAGGGCHRRHEGRRGRRRGGRSRPTADA